MIIKNIKIFFLLNFIFLLNNIKYRIKPNIAFIEFDLSPVNIIEIIKNIVIKKPNFILVIDLLQYFSKMNPEQIKQNPKRKWPIFNSSLRKLAILSGSTDEKPNIFCLKIYSK